MDKLNNSFNKLFIHNKQCVICYNNYIINNNVYDNSDVLCIICSKKYNEYMFDYIEIT